MRQCSRRPCSSPPSGAPTRQRCRSRGSAQPHWIELTSRHFTLRTDLPRAPGARRARRLRGRLRHARDGRLPGRRAARPHRRRALLRRGRLPQAGAARRRRLLHAAAGGRSRAAADHRHPRAHAHRRHAGRDDAAALPPRADPSLPRSSAALDAAVARGGAGRVLLDARRSRAATPSSARCPTPRSCASTSTSTSSLDRTAWSRIASTSPRCRRCSSF